MAGPSSLTRRVFLVSAGTLAAGLAAGLAVGAWAVRREPRNPLLQDLPPGDVTLNPWLRIGPDGITLITPRADLGQGAYSVQAALIAEELDLDWGQFRIEPGPPSAAYWNGRVLAESMPIAATSDSFLARTGRDVGAAMGKLLGLQLTGGSSTVADGFDRLRVAGAVARRMLMQAAARQTGAPLEQLTTHEGQVVLPDGRRLAYTALAAAAANESAPHDVALKPASQWRLLGRPMRRLDMEDKCTGRVRYGIDVRLPGLLHATVRTNPRLGGGVRSLDAARAKRMRGVLDVVSVEGGFGVIADNTWRAFEAARQVDVSWGPAPYPPTTSAIFDSVASAFTSERRDSRFLDRGDVEARWLGAQAAERIEAEYRVPCLAHAPLEPMNATVCLKDGWLDIWTGTQIPRIVVASAAKLAGIDESHVRLHAQLSGGSFGRRLEDDYVRQAVQLAVARPGRPIQMVWSREEDMTHDLPRPPAIGRARGVVGKGQVDSFDLSIAMPSVSASQGGRWGLPVAGPDTTIVAGAWDQPFAIANHRVTGYRSPPIMPISSWRSVGASGNGFIHESFFDELIHAAGADPLKERLRLCSHEPSRRVLEAVGELSAWDRPLAPSAEGRRGRGLAFVLAFGVPTAEVVEVTATARGIRIDQVFVVAEVGRVLDPVNFENQVQGGVIWGLGHAINAELTYEDGMPQQNNFHAYEGLRLYQTPRIVVKALETGSVAGMGEPSVPPAAPALANAIHAATGRRIRELPLRRHIDFV